MNLNFWLPLFIPMTSLVAGVVIFFLPEENRPLRSFLNMGSAVLKILLVFFLVWGVFHEQTYRFTLPLFLEFALVLEADSLALLFVVLSSVLWLVTTLYAIGYLEHGFQRGRFFGFFSLCVSATTGIALAGNLFTFLVFYEFLTLTTYPLVTHRGTEEAIQAGRVYLLYTLSAGVVLLVAMVWLSSSVGVADFEEGGIMEVTRLASAAPLKAIFWMLILGFGVKAALIPLHGWLPVAMVAPAPVSALLHAVAVVKAGVFGIVRVIYDVFGVETCTAMGVRDELMLLASATILYGSLRAVFQDDFKRRLAYSTVSQVSYITLGAAMVGPLATIGGIAHLAHQGMMKITMFFCAGNVAEEMHIHKISELRGAGRRMPLTMAAFTVAAMGMIGVPPMAGFFSKWFLGLGAMDAGLPAVIGVLLASSALNAIYFLPIIYYAWFCEPDHPHPERPPGRRWEIHPYLLLPPLFTALATILLGFLAATPFSPMSWARLIMMREYGQ
ncbi:MAG: complex I subunit 5 family protein [Desulfococcaceae bacterium]